MRYITLWMLVFSSLHAQNMEDYLNTIRTDPNALYAFFKAMPKGGELHYHLTGSTEAEVLLDVAAQHHLCIDPKTAQLSSTSLCFNRLSRTMLEHQPERYNHIVETWSMKNFNEQHTLARHDHFFSAFSKFDPLYKVAKPQLLAELLQKAALENEHYLEIIALHVPHSTLEALTPALSSSADFNSKQRALLQHPAFQTSVDALKTEAHDLLHQTRQILHCDTASAQAACSLTVTFQIAVRRTEPLDSVLIQTLVAFAAAAASPELVGVNLVQPEDHLTALRDYNEQMRFFKWMHQHYPQVHIALHAGELTPELVGREALRFHIQNALLIGQAQRIGHGVDIAYEKNSLALLKYMKTHAIPVEINLTSNQTILNIAGRQHPLHFYLAHHVPLVLSTDDAGILRTDLTTEYVRAVSEQHLTYTTLKTMNRNTLTYSFLPGESFWLNPEQGIPVSACQDQHSLTCKVWIKQSKKAQLQWQLEQDLNKFEAQIADPSFF